MEVLKTLGVEAFGESIEGCEGGEWFGDLWFREGLVDRWFCGEDGGVFEVCAGAVGEIEFCVEAAA